MKAAFFVFEVRGGRKVFKGLGAGGGVEKSNLVCKMGGFSVIELLPFFFAVRL